MDTFNKNITRISKLPKSLTTTKPTFDGKTEKIELFENLFHTSLKIHNQLTEQDEIKYFHTLVHGVALQTFKNTTSPNRENLWEILTVFREKYVKLQSVATGKHKFQRLVLSTANQKLFDFLDELQKLAKDTFGVAAQAIFEQFIYAKLPPHLEKSINQAHFENGTYEQIVSLPENELELKPQMKCKSTLWHNKSHNKTLKSPNQRATNAKNQLTIKISAVNSNEKKTKSKITRIVQEITIIKVVVTKQTPTPTIKFQAITRRLIQTIRETEDLNLSSHPVRPVVELTTPQRIITLEQTQQTDRLPGIDNRKDKTKSNREMLKESQMRMSKLQPKL